MKRESPHQMMNYICEIEDGIELGTINTVP